MTACAEGDLLVNAPFFFDFTTDLNGIAEAYAVMDERRAIKSLVKVGTV